METDQQNPGIELGSADGHSITIDQSTTEPVNRLTPYLCAFAGIIAVFLGTLAISVPPMLAFTLATIGGLLGFLGCRLIQLRGRLTLAIVVIGIPLIVALVFAAIHNLNPFVKRQRSISMLRDSRIQYRARRADQGGEWKRDRDGNMLPTWLANRIGPDCLSQLTAIDAELSEIQSIHFSNLDPTYLTRVRLSRPDETPTLSIDLVKWLNEIESPTIDISLHGFTADDVAALNQLKHEYRLSLAVDHFTGDLSSIKTATFLELRGTTLSDQQADQLAQLSTYSILKLESFRISPDLITKLTPSHLNGRQLTLSFENIALDTETLEALAKIENRPIILSNVRFPKSLQMDEKVYLNYLNRRLVLLGGNPTVDGLRNLLGVFQCKELLVQSDATEEQLASLFEFPDLESIEHWPRDSNQICTYVRPEVQSSP